MDIFAVLSDAFWGLPLERDFCFSRHTTIGCGGTASLSASPRDLVEAQTLIKFLEREKIPYCLLGAGANVLPTDETFEGVVVRFRFLNRIRLEEGRIVAEAGVTGGALLTFARRNRIGGFAPFTGIPMTLGGATVMNAGVAGGHISDLLLEAEGVEKGVLRRFSLADCGFGEKKSVFQDKIAVLRVVLRAEPSTVEKIAQETEHYRARRAHLPKGRSMGCVFVNPEGFSAGRLIDECGLKGLSVGGAHVAREHANFIINEGGSAADISALIDRVKREVERRTGILLREEIRRIP